MAKKAKQKLKEEPECQIKKIITKSRKEFLGLRYFLEARGNSFLWTSSGTINSIVYNGVEWISVDLNESGGKGHHLNRIFKRDVDEWLEEFGADMEPYPNDYQEQFFNLEAIEKNIGEPLVLIDINDCYWRTSFILKYMKQITYIKGLKKKEWKNGRNGCIGSLRKLKVEIPYINGVRDLSGRRRIPTPIQYHWIRNHVIGHVYQLFFRLFEEIGNDFFMFLTDCVVTTYKNKLFVEKYFADNGYKCKSKPVEFTRVDRIKKVIYWYDFNAENEGKKGREKFYHYASHQLIGGTTDSSIKNTNDLINNSIDLQQLKK